jgi:hypothetical protein
MLAEIEGRLKGFWQDHRLFEIWAEYHTAIQIKKRNPEWDIKVSPNMRDDVVCHTLSGDKIKVQVKTGLWDLNMWKRGGPAMVSADATFSPFQIENQESFQYAVFFVHENYQKVKWIFVFSREDLEEVTKVKRQGNRASFYFVTKVESLEAYKKWQEQFDPPERIFNIEKRLVEEPEVFRDKWDRIK